MQANAQTYGRPGNVSRGSRTVGLAGLHVGFALTGAYTALVGAALPLIAAHWRLPDDRLGAMFLAQFLGSMTGALVRGPRLLLLVAAGFALVGVACGALAAVTGWAALPVLYLYGVGLGMAMTSTSVWMHSRFAHSGSALESLNAVWAAGAGAAPWVVLPWVRPAGLGYFLALASLPAWGFAVWLLVWSRTGSRLPAQPRQESLAGGVSRAAGLAVALWVLSFGAVGVESALGGWMTTYVARVGQAGLFSASGAASGFWLGLLGSRMLATVLLLGALTLQQLMWGALTLALAGVALLLTVHPPWMLLVCAVACGAGVGPVYPLVLTVALRFFRGRWMFVAAGLGAASLPWCTGVVSRGAGSLRAGLVLPFGMLVVMGVALAVGRRWWGRDAEGEAGASLGSV